MKKQLLIAGACLAALATQAENKIYFFSYEDPQYGTQYTMGEVYGISDNGRYAAIYDVESDFSYLWDREKPTELQRINREIDGQVIAFTAYSVTNDGMVVGSERPRGNNQWQPVTWENGEIRRLPIPDEALNSNYPIAVTGDGKIIGGHIVTKDEAVETGKRSFPCIWELGSDGEYIMHLYNDLELPNMQGFFPTAMYSDGTVKGTYLGGTLNAGNGSFVAALYHNHELKVWHELKTVNEPWYYKGEIMGYTDIGYIDGVHDGATGDWAMGSFYGADAHGYFYGTRDYVTLKDPETKEGTYKHVGAAYNVLTDTWEESENFTTFSNGFEGKILFTRGAQVLTNGANSPEAQYFQGYYEVEGGRSLNSMDKASKDGSVMGGTFAETNPASGEPQYFPYIVVLDSPQTSIQSIIADAETNIGIIVADGRIDVSGAKNVAIYDMDGRLVSNSSSANVEAGIYVVKADTLTRKVLVK